MTIREWAVKYCFEKGMFQNDAEKVIEMAMSDEINEAMKGRWNDRVDGYPQPLFAVLAVSIDAIAVKWIEANCPQAWYKPMFQSGNAG